MDSTDGDDDRDRLDGFRGESLSSVIGDRFDARSLLIPSSLEATPPSLGLGSGFRFRV